MTYKKVLGMAAAIALVVVPFGLNAFVAEGGERVQRTETVTSDYYVAGAEVQNDAIIEGDMVVAGANVFINKEIQEDLTAAGARVVVDGVVGDDLRVAGSAIEINENVLGDVIVFGAEVRIKKDVTIAGNLFVAGGVLVMDGTVEGDARIYGGQIHIGGLIQGDANIGVDEDIFVSEGAQIQGNLEYTSRKEIEELSAIVQGEITYNESMVEQAKEMRSAVIAHGFKYMLMKWLALVFFGCLLVMLVSKLFATSGSMLAKKPGQSIVYGLALLVGMPLLALVLCISVIGLPVGFFVFMLYIFLFVFAELLGVAVFSHLFMQLFKKKKVWIRWEKILMVAFVSLLFVIINGIDMIAVFFAWGAILLAFKDKGVEVLSCDKK